MTQRRPIDDVLRRLGVRDTEILDHLRCEGLFPEDEVSNEEAEEFRVAVVLMREMGVNAAGVDVILRMRQRLVTLQSRSEQALRLLLQDAERSR